MPAVKEPEVQSPPPAPAEVTTPVPAQPEIFAAEIEMEQKSSSIVPLLLILVLVGAIVGAVVYFYRDSQKTLPQAEAVAFVTDLLKSQGPATVHFHSGLVKPSVDEKPGDPHYKLLEKAGIVMVHKTKDGSALVGVTPTGEKLIASFPGFEKGKNADGTTAYTVPLAERTLIEVSKVTMINPNQAWVDYKWKWTPNRLGEIFDASGATVKSFNQWDRATLIKKYGVDFYKQEQQPVRINVSRTDKGGWKLTPPE